MHIGVSAWRLHGQRMGIGRYIEYILRHWGTMLAPDERVTLFLHEPLDTTSLQLTDAFRTTILGPKMTNALWENLLLPRAARDVDVLFGPSYTLPLTYSGRSVVAIHSVDEAEPGAQSLWHSLTYAQKYRLSARRADRVIVNARSIGERVHALYGVPEERIDTIWLGADAAFRPLDDEAQVQASRQRLLGAIGVITSENPLHAALSLVGPLIGVAVLFIAQDAEFLAAVQVIVYAGAIVVLFLFVIMLIGVDSSEDITVEPLSGQRLAATIGGLILAVGLIGVVSIGAVTGDPASSDPVSGAEPNTEAIARVLFTDHLLAFEITSVLLVIAVVGAVALARHRHAALVDDDNPGDEIPAALASDVSPGEVA